MWVVLWVLLLSTLEQDMALLESSVLRIEVDPQTFSLRYVRLVGGNNFLQPHYLDDTARLGNAWLNAEGLYAEIGLATAEDAALRRGPAWEVEKGDTFIAMLGPRSEKSGLRFKKELRIDAQEGGATYTPYPYFAKRHTPQDIALEALCQISPGTVVVGLNDAGEEQGRGIVGDSEEEALEGVTVILHESVHRAVDGALYNGLKFATK